MDANSSENLPVPRFCGIFRAMCPLRFAWETNTWITHPAAPITRAPEKKTPTLNELQCPCAGISAIAWGCLGRGALQFWSLFPVPDSGTDRVFWCLKHPVCVLTKMAWAKVGTRQTTHSCHCCCRPAFHVPVPPPLNHSAQCLCLAKMAPSGSP